MGVQKKYFQSAKDIVIARCARRISFVLMHIEKKISSHTLGEKKMNQLNLSACELARDIAPIYMLIKNVRVNELACFK